jgi:hydroxyacylglutathione hydrolase
MKITRLVTGPLSVNTWFIPLDEGRMIVVDPGGDSEMIISHLSGLNARVSLFFLTHGHFDHLIALPALAKAFPEADIAIHSGDARFLGEGALELHHAFFTSLGAASLIKKFLDPLPAPTIILDEGSPPVLRDGTPLAPWTVMHTPGHSKGSVCLYNKSGNTLISGDTLFNSGYGRTDSDGGSLEELHKSLARLFLLPGGTEVLPGHGPNTTIAREQF